MAKDAVFTMKLEPELRDAFVAAAEAVDRPASQIVREMMRDFVAKDRQRQEYEEFYRRKVEKARRSLEAGIFHTNEEVDALMEARIAQLARRKGGKRT